MQELTVIPITVSEFKIIIAEAIHAEFNTRKKEDSNSVNEDRLIKINEVCTLLNVSKVTIHTWKRKGLLPFHRISNKIYFKKSEVLSALKIAGGKS